MLKLTCNSQEVTSPVKLFGIGNNNSDGFKIKGFLITIFPIIPKNGSTISAYYTI